MAVAIEALVAMASIETSAPRSPFCSSNRASKAGMAVNSDDAEPDARLLAEHQAGGGGEG